MPSYILHWNPGHLSVGQVVSVQSEDVSVLAAQQWALVEMGKHGAAAVSADASAWTPANHHDAWWSLDAISATQYYLRRYDGEWYLLKTFARVEGSGPGLGHPAEAISWADTVLARKLGLPPTGDWVAGPDSPDSSTLVKHCSDMHLPTGRG